MYRYKVTYTKKIEEIILAENPQDAKKKIETSELFEIKKVEYVYEGSNELKEYYCNWWNGYNWKSKVVKAHSKKEIMENIRNELGIVYDFYFCLNNEKDISRLMEAIWD